jgi:AcrR family transcriptional regulator
MRAAEDLFYAEGVRAVGVERLLEVSGVGRASFYRHFESKDDLVFQVLTDRDERWRGALDRAVTARGREPLAVFDALTEQFEAADFRGCAFINIMIEDADPGSTIFHLADEHKRAVTKFIEDLLSDAGHQDTAALAEQFVLLMDGAQVTALRTRSVEPAYRAKAIAAALLAAQT